jgi:hypothetical protein
VAVYWPAFEKLRFDEDYTGVREAVEGASFPENIKYMLLGGDAGGSYLSFGGEVRERYEYTHNPTVGEDPQDDNGGWLQRIVLNSDLHLSRQARIFLQLLSAEC